MFSHAACTQPVKTWVVFTNFNHACEVYQITTWRCPAFWCGSRSQTCSKILAGRWHNFGGPQGCSSNRHMRATWCNRFYPICLYRQCHLQHCCPEGWWGGRSQRETMQAVENRVQCVILQMQQERVQYCGRCRRSQLNLDAGWVAELVWTFWGETQLRDPKLPRGWRWGRILLGC